MAITIFLIAIVAYKLHEYRHYLLFWRYSTMKLEKKIEEASGMESYERRVQLLQDLSATFDKRKREGGLDSQAYLFSGKVHSLLGEAFLGQSFTDMVIYDRTGNIPHAARKQFIRSIKDFQKASTLSGSSDFETDYLIHFARSLFFADYFSLKDIYGLIHGIDKLADIDDIRFFSYVKVLSNKEEEGLKYLSRDGKIDTVQGKLFLATVERSVRRHTSAIVNFKEVLEKTTDEGVMKLAQMNLGMIYYNQSLFDESLIHLNEAHRLDNKDNMVKILMGKSYLALGAKDKARAILNEVIASDNTNVEARKLLGAI